MGIVKRTVIVRTEHAGLHFWAGADKSNYRQQFLQHPHRHLFKVTVEITVDHGDRSIEFFTLKEELDAYLGEVLEHTFDRPIGFSCEDLAAMVCDYLLYRGYRQDMSIEVSEDGENSGKVYYER